MFSSTDLILLTSVVLFASAPTVVAALVTASVFSFLGVSLRNTLRNANATGVTITAAKQLLEYRA